MQMTMQTLPVLPFAGDPIAPAPKGDGGKAAPDTFALLLGRRLETLPAVVEGAPTPWAALVNGPAAPAQETPAAPFVPWGEKGEGGTPREEKGGMPGEVPVAKDAAVFPPLPPLSGGAEALPQEDVPGAQGTGILPEPVPAVVAEGTDVRPATPEPAAELPPIPLFPEAPFNEPPAPIQALLPVATPPSEVAAPPPPARDDVLPGPATPPPRAKEPIPAAAAVLSDRAEVVQDAPAERPAGLLERQFGDLLETRETPSRPRSSAGVPEFRPALHSAAATSAPASPQAAPAAVEAPAKPSPAPAADVLPPPFAGMEEGAPPPPSHPSTHIHPVAGEGAVPFREQPQAAPPAVHLPSGQAVPESRIVDQVIGRLAVGAEGEGGAMTLKLNPKELGEVTVELVVEKDRVKAQIIAQNQQVQEVLERHLPKLRTALENQGLRLDTLQVSVDSHGDGGRGFFQEHQRPSAPVRFAYRGEADPVREPDPVPSSASPQGRGINLRI